MSLEGQKFYPGEGSTPDELLALADEYKRAAETLLPNGRRRVPRSQAPYRLVAIHAIELYLNAFLVAAGLPPDQVRGYQHNLAKRTPLARLHRLILRKKTVGHLEALTLGRDYLATRYDPRAAAAYPLNRLKATLDEVAEKVRDNIELKN
jgi:hypothetical protein